MSIKVPGGHGGRYYPPILKSEIEEAQRHTNSNKAAARYLKTSYLRYKKYAKLYGLFDSHMNEAGFGIEKGFSKRPTSIPLKEILEGKHPSYSIAKLKNRLIARKKLAEECALCGFHERRITDNRVPLIINFKDGNRKNFSLENLELYCYNCIFLTTGAPTVVYRKTLNKALYTPERIQKSGDVVPTSADAHDPDDHLPPDEEVFLTDDEREALLKELGQA